MRKNEHDITKEILNKSRGLLNEIMNNNNMYGDKVDSDVKEIISESLKEKLTDTLDITLTDAYVKKENDIKIYSLFIDAGSLKLFCKYENSEFKVFLLGLSEGKEFELNKDNMNKLYKVSNGIKTIDVSEWEI